MAQNSGGRGWRGGRWAGSWFDEPAAWGTHYASPHYPPGSEEMSVILPAFPGWIFHVTFSPAGEAIGFEVSPSTHGELPPPVTARFLKSLPLGAIQELARAGAASVSTSFAPYSESARRWVAVFEDVRRPGRRGRGDLAYAQLAAAYVAKVASGSARPVEDLAAETGYSASRVRNLIYEARRRGLLSKAAPGRSGGDLEEKARNLLESTEGD